MGFLPFRAWAVTARSAVRQGLHLRPSRCIPRASYATGQLHLQPEEVYDVVIVGGGPAGLSLASSLRSSYVTENLRVALIEGMELGSAKIWKPSPNTYSNRVSSLTPGSVEFLTSIGAWRHVREKRVQAYTNMQVWDGISGSSISFSFDLQESSNAVAYMTENTNLVSALLSRLAELGGTDIMDKTRVEAIFYGNDTGDFDYTSWPVVQVSSGKRLGARLLVGADGANSPVRTFAGIESRGWEYGRHGVVASLKLAPASLPHGNTAYQRFLPTGPVAMLPLPENMASLVWSTTPEIAATLKALDPEDFTAMVNAAFRLSIVDLEYLCRQSTGHSEEVAWREKVSIFDSNNMPSKVVEVQDKSIASFPLKMRHADTYISERIALVGDAAHSVHPLAGQGLNQGIGDVRSLVKTLENAVRYGQDIGSLLSLESYVSEQFVKNNAILGTVDKLHMLYGTSSRPIVALRSVGLDIVNALTPLKKFIMGQAMGR